jgi:hypothetical protein
LLSDGCHVGIVQLEVPFISFVWFGLVWFGLGAKNGRSRQPGEVGVSICWHLDIKTKWMRRKPGNERKKWKK